MKSKETIFSKNNYDLQLEEILDNKEFNDEAKSLILSVLYKIEESYKDYAKVKLNVKLKNEIIEEIINIIKFKCDKIVILNPKKTKKQFQVDRKNKIIEVFPNEVSLLQAIYYINTPNAKTMENIFDRVLMEIINKGEAINNVEIIRDFNGWSWNNVIEKNINKYYNLIFQDLLILLGNSNLYEIIKSHNVRESLQDKFNELYGERNSSLLINMLEKTCILIYMYNNAKNKKEVFDYLEKIKIELLNISNKSEYISKITIKNNNNMKTVSKIENILKSEALISKKYNNDKIRQKYSNIDEYKEYLNNIRKSKIEEINKNNNLINPFEYVKRKRNIEKEVQCLNDIDVLLKKDKAVYNSLIRLQRQVISCLYKKIEIYDLKKELVNLIYEIRYYNFLPVEKEKKIKDIKELELDLRSIQKKLTNKLCENKVVDTFAKDYNINYNIVKYIFVAKLTNINKLQVLLKYQNKKLFLSYYDEKVLENEEKINFSEDDLSELNKKMNKKMRIII